MDFINFMNDAEKNTNCKGSTEGKIKELEYNLGFTLPQALKEYLSVTGESAFLFSPWDYHGTNDIQYMHEWIYEWINRYRNEGIALSEIESILPFFKWQDTFFYIPIYKDNNDPPVFAFDINDKPTIRKLEDNFSNFIKRIYNKATWEIDI